MLPFNSSVSLEPIRASIEPFLMFDTPIYPSMHPEIMMSSLFLMAEIYALCCFIPEIVENSEVLGVNSLILLSSQAMYNCLPESVNPIVLIALSQ